MPFLAMLNGNPGMGKSTFAQRYADDHAMVLNIDVDRIWHMIGQWQTSRPESDRLKRYYTAQLAGLHLQRGYDVIVADLFESADECARLETVAREHGADFVEVALLSNSHDAIERCKTRARSMGYSDGFRPGGVLDTSGREDKLRSMYRNVVRVSTERTNTVRINSVNGRTDETYAALLATLERYT